MLPLAWIVCCTLVSEAMGGARDLKIVPVFRGDLTGSNLLTMTLLTPVIVLAGGAQLFTI